MAHRGEPGAGGRQAQRALGARTASMTVQTLEFSQRTMGDAPVQGLLGHQAGGSPRQAPPRERLSGLRQQPTRPDGAKSECPRGGEGATGVGGGAAP